MLSTLFPLKAETHFPEVHSISEIRPHLKNLPPDTLLFFDIDDTLITPKSITFRAPPYNKLIDDIKKNQDQYPHYQQIISNWRLQRQVMLIESDWPFYIRELQQTFPVFGLTKMDVGTLGNIKSMEKWRYEELRSLGIEFSSHSTLAYEVLEGAAFYKGVLLTGPSSKGQALQKYWEHFLTSTLILIDDRKEHLEDVKKLCDERGVIFIGILYKGLERVPGEPDPSIAAFQQAYLINHAQWLEDEEARYKMRHLEKGRENK